jgi:hypothetical protein
MSAVSRTPSFGAQSVRPRLLCTMHPGGGAKWRNGRRVERFRAGKVALRVSQWQAAHTRTVPVGGYMPSPSPRRIRSVVAGASFLRQGSTRLTKWTIEDAGPALRNEVACLQTASLFRNPLLAVSTAVCPVLPSWS